MLQVVINNKPYSIVKEDNDWFINGEKAVVDIAQQANGLISILLNGRSYTAISEKTDRKAKEVVVRLDGQMYEAAIKEPIDQLLANMGMDLAATRKAEPVKAPMPGLVLKILVTEGQEINKGDSLIVLEAMKMENVLKAAAPGKIKAIKVGERTAVEKGMVLIEME